MNYFLESKYFLILLDTKRIFCNQNGQIIIFDVFLSDSFISSPPK